MGTTTYLLGKDAVFFDKAFLAELPMVFPRTYISNWRMLHIDGFEDLYPLPAHLGRTIRFSFGMTV
jgi:hypothetical protein